MTGLLMLLCQSNMIQHYSKNAKKNRKRGGYRGCGDVMWTWWMEGGGTVRDDDSLFYKVTRQPTIRLVPSVNTMITCDDRFY